MGNDDKDDPRVVRDKNEITELLFRYARACDSQDHELLRSVFTEDAVLDFTSAGHHVAGRDEMIPHLITALRQVSWCQHVISNIEIDLNGDRADVRAMFFTPMRLPGMAEPSCCGGNYYHEVVRTPDGWKSRKFAEDNKWFVNRPSAPKAKLMVFSNAKDGRDDEYNEWYDTTHLGDVLAVPGVTAGARYRAKDVADAGAPEHRYLAVYELDRDPDAVLRDLAERAAADPSRMSDSLDMSSVKITVWEQT